MNPASALLGPPLASPAASGKTTQKKKKTPSASVKKSSAPASATAPVATPMVSYESAAKTPSASVKKTPSVMPASATVVVATPMVSYESVAKTPSASVKKSSKPASATALVATPMVSYESMPKTSSASAKKSSKPASATAPVATPMVSYESAAKTPSASVKKSSKPASATAPVATPMVSYESAAKTPSASAKKTPSVMPSATGLVATPIVSYESAVKTPSASAKKTPSVMPSATPVVSYESAPMSVMTAPKTPSASMKKSSVPASASATAVATPMVSYESAPVSVMSAPKTPSVVASVAPEGLTSPAPALDIFAPEVAAEEPEVPRNDVIHERLRAVKGRLTNMGLTPKNAAEEIVAAPTPKMLAAYFQWQTGKDLAGASLAELEAYTGYEEDLVKACGPQAAFLTLAALDEMLGAKKKVSLWGLPYRNPGFFYDEMEDFIVGKKTKNLHDFFEKYDFVRMEDDTILVGDRRGFFFTIDARYRAGAAVADGRVLFPRCGTRLVFWQKKD